MAMQRLSKDAFVTVLLERDLRPMIRFIEILLVLLFSNGNFYLFLLY